MLIKYQALLPQLQKKLQTVYVLIGSDHYLLNDAAWQIKKAWRQCGETDEKIIDLNSAADWGTLHEEANSYSLFSEQVLLDARLDKKSIDAQGKAILSQYLQSINPKCLIIIRASLVPAKQLQWLTNNEHVTVVQIMSLTGSALHKWIIDQLQSHSLLYNEQVPALLQQYTQGNLLACAQAIEKLTLISDKKTVLGVDEVRQQLTDQCDYQLYDLADACLAANAEKALHLLRQACNNRTEPTLILWLLTQEIRNLIQLAHAQKQHVPFATACAQQKIWPQRVKLYETTLAHFSLIKLYTLLQESKRLDEQIKTTNSRQIWNNLEQLALSLCLRHSFI